MRGARNLFRRFAFFCVLCLFVVVRPTDGFAGEPAHRSLANTRVKLPTAQEFLDVLLLRQYTTRLVVLGTVLLGSSSAVVGTFMLLRKRSLVGDVVGHAALPGVAAGFLVLEVFWPGHGRWLPGLLTGAVIGSLLALASTTAIRRYTRIKEDAALALVLGVFFGAGIALFTIVQDMPTGGQAGLHHFIYGRAASIVAADIQAIAAASLVVGLLFAALFKEFSLLCFDERFAQTQGWPAGRLDAVLMLSVVLISVIGMQSVGLLLVVALLVIPPSAARFWTERLDRMTCIAVLLGGTSAWIGVMMSALFPRLPAGAMIVLVGAGFFGISLLFGARRGVIRRLLIHWDVQRRVNRCHLLRTLFEAMERRGAVEPAFSPASNDEGRPPSLVVPLVELAEARSWTPAQVRRLYARAELEGLVAAERDGYRLTRFGLSEARRVVRNHRLWEMYLIRYADVAPGLVDRDADRIEHWLDPEVLAELDELLRKQAPQAALPASPHAISART